MTDQTTVSLEINSGGTPLPLTSRTYYTACAPMWTTAGADLPSFDSQRALRILGDLENAVEDMTDNPNTYEALNPPNGEGDYAGCLAFLQALVDDVCAHPKATVRVVESQGGQ